MSAAPATLESPEALDEALWTLLDPVPVAASGDRDAADDVSDEDFAALVEALDEDRGGDRLVELALQHMLLREVAQEEDLRSSGAPSDETSAVLPVADSSSKSSRRTSKRRSKRFDGPPDEELVEQAERNVPGAFDMLVERYSSLVVGVAYSLLSDIEASRDVAQDAFLEAARTLNMLRERGKFGNWVYGIARRKAIYVLRRRKMHQSAIKHRKDREEARETPDDPGDPLARTERRQQIRNALNQLPEIYREILVLKYMDGRSYDEIAKILGISLAAVDKRLMRGKAMLRESLRRWIVD